MNKAFFQITFSIASIFSCRMLGLFMLIPVFTRYAPQLSGATPELMGIALGCYGLSQALLQIPLGLWSDRIGRHKVIRLGLAMFGVGSLIGATTHSIYGMILARTLQGMGAIGSVLIALLSDLTTEKERSFAMAILGISIGLSFTIALIISPILTSHFQTLSSIFYVTFFLIMVAFLLLRTIPMPPPCTEPHAHYTWPDYQKILTQPALMSLNLGIFIQHFILTALFFILPMHLKQQHIVASTFYLPILSGSLLCLFLLLYWAEKKQQTRFLLNLSIMIIAVTQLLCSARFIHTHRDLQFLLFIYFVAFNILESLLPSLISKRAPLAHRGLAMGIYSSSQFLGIFAGGVTAGLVFANLGETGVFATNAFLALLMMFIMMRYRKIIVVH